VPGVIYDFCVGRGAQYPSRSSAGQASTSEVGAARW
jgi:hypothetical protein